MKINSKIKWIGFVAVFGWAAMVLLPAAAADSVSIQSAVQSARQQGLAEKVINDLLAEGLENGLKNDQIAELFSFAWTTGPG